MAKKKRLWHKKIDYGIVHVVPLLALKTPNADVYPSILQKGRRMNKYTSYISVICSVLSVLKSFFFGYTAWLVES